MFDLSEGQAGALGAGVQLAGGIIGSAVSARQAAKQRDFQKWMMRNRYQLQMEDMRKAGLNPILAAGASPPSPAGAAASIGNPAAGVAASARELGLMKKQAQLLEAQKNAQDANAGAAGTMAGYNFAKMLNELNRVPETSAKAEFHNSGLGRMMLRGKMGAEYSPNWMRPSSYLGYSAAAGWSSAKDFQSFVGSKSGYRKDRTVTDDLAEKLYQRMQMHLPFLGDW